MAQKSDPFAALLASIPGGNAKKPTKKKKSGGGGNNNKNSSATIKGVTVGAKLGPGEIRDIVAASTLTPEQVITRAENRNIRLALRRKPIPLLLLHHLIQLLQQPPQEPVPQAKLEVPQLMELLTLLHLNLRQQRLVTNGIRVSNCAVTRSRCNRAFKVRS